MREVRGDIGGHEVEAVGVELTPAMLSIVQLAL